MSEWNKIYRKIGGAQFIFSEAVWEMIGTFLFCFFIVATAVAFVILTTPSDIPARDGRLKVMSFKTGSAPQSHFMKMLEEKTFNHHWEAP